MSTEALCPEVVMSVQVKVPAPASSRSFVSSKSLIVSRLRVRRRGFSGSLFFRFFFTLASSSELTRQYIETKTSKDTSSTELWQPAELIQQTAALASVKLCCLLNQ